MGVLGAGGGGNKSAPPPYEQPDNLRSVQYARIIDLVGEGEMEGFDDPDHPLRCVFLNETPVENGDGTFNFKDFNIQSRFGTQIQEPVNGFEAVESELNVSFELHQGVPWVRAITNPNLTRTRITVGVPVLYVVKDNGDQVGGQIDFDIEMSVDGAPFESVIRASIIGKTTSMYKRSYVIDLPPMNTGVTLRVTKVSADPSSSQVQATLLVDSYTEIVDVRLRMPMSAYHALKFDAKQFPNIPSRAYFMKGIRVSVPTNYDPVTRAYDGIWDGTFKQAWTDNPAWHLYEMATNARFGLGHLVTPALVEKWLLYGIAQYCDELVPDGRGGMEPRFTCNMYLQTQDDALRVMMSIASVFRGVLFNAHNTIMAVQDRPQEVDDWIYTPANVIGGKFVYSGSGRKARHTVALVSWNDPSDFYRAKVQYVEDEEGIARYGYRPSEVIAPGCSSQGQATRAGKHILLTERYATDTVSFEVGLDGVIPQPGRVIAIQDPLKARVRHSGRIVEPGTVNGVTVDLMPATVAIGDILTVALPNGATERRTISNIVDKTFFVSVPFSAAPIKHAVWLAETVTIKAQRFRVLSVTENDDPTQLGYTVVGLQHVDGIYAAIEQNIKFDEPPITSGFSKIQMPVASVSMTHRDVADYNSTQKIVTAAWTAIAGADHYLVSWRYDKGDWNLLPPQAGLSADIAGIVPGVFELKVEVVNASGAKSPATYGGPYDIGPNIKPPGFVDDINADIGDALAAAENAIAIADGAVVTFWQSSPPVIGAGEGQAKVGDIWFDTDDGNHIYRVVGSTWTSAQDDKLALAIAAAATAQATADGKATLYSGTVPPASGMSLNDLFFNETTKKTFRYNGSDWNTPVADVTLDQLGGNGINLLPDQYSTFEAATLPPITNPSAVPISRDGAVKVIAGALILGGSGAAYLGNAFGILKLTPGKKYIVSGWFRKIATGKQAFLAIETRGGTYYYSPPFTLSTANTWERHSAILDLSANTQTDAWLLVGNNAAGDLYVDGLMVEEAVGNLNKPSTYARGSATGMALSAILAAANAQATADGSIDIFRQASPPSGAKFGDYWQDTGNGRWYAWDGATWVESTDNRIPQAITDAASAAAAASGAQTTANNANTAASTAQTTANSKIRLFYQEAQPTATTNGDMWFKPSTKETRYWNGSGWSLQADQTAAVADMLVLNGDFEQGTQSWVQETNWYAEASTSASINGSGTGMVRAGHSSYPNSQLYNEKLFAVTPGQKIFVSGMVRNLFGTANGQFAVGIIFYDANDQYITQMGQFFSDASYIPGTEWRQVQKTLYAPGRALRARAYAYAANHTAGHWCLDNVRARLVDSEAPNASSGDNLVPNPSFSENAADFPLDAGHKTLNAPVAFGWKVGEVGGSYASRHANTEARGTARQLFLGDFGGTSPAGDYSYVTVHSEQKIPVAIGEKLWLRVSGSVAAGNALPAGVNFYGYLGLWCYTDAGAYNGFVGHIQTALGDYDTALQVTIPAGTSYVRFGAGAHWSNGNGHAVAMPWATRHLRVFHMLCKRVMNLDQSVIEHGTVYGKTANEDLYDVSGVRRIGTSVTGSRKRVGGPRNLPAALVNGVSAVRTATALTATSAGAVTVNAFSANLNEEIVSYSAVTNAVVGLSQGTNYAIYTLDPFQDGGVRTWYAATSILQAQQAGIGVVIAGNVTIPTSGSSGGGGGGNVPPDEYCVDYDSMLPDGRYVRDLQLGDLVCCIDVATGEVGMFPLLGMGEGWEECYRLLTSELHSVIQSKSTPMDLPDGSVRRTPDMYGQPVWIPGKLTKVAHLQYLGPRKVLKPDFGNRMFFAGEAADKTIATHNVLLKP